MNYRLLSAQVFKRGLSILSYVIVSNLFDQSTYPLLNKSLFDIDKNYR